MFILDIFIFATYFLKIFNQVQSIGKNVLCKNQASIAAMFDCVHDTCACVVAVSDTDSPCSPFDISITKMLPSTSPHTDMAHHRNKYVCPTFNPNIHAFKQFVYINSF